MISFKFNNVIKRNQHQLFLLLTDCLNFKLLYMEEWRHSYINDEESVFRWLDFALLTFQVVLCGYSFIALAF